MKIDTNSDLTSKQNPTIYEILSFALQVVDQYENIRHYRKVNPQASFSAPIEVDIPCIQCDSPFVTEIFDDGIFVCLECGDQRI